MFRMARLKQFIDILNLIKFEHELTIGQTEEAKRFNWDTLKIIESSLEKIRLSLDDLELLSLINQFLEISEDEKLELCTNLSHTKCIRDSLTFEFNVLTQKLKLNQDRISTLESENSKLKNDLRVNKINLRHQPSHEDKSNFISPSFIRCSFKFDIKIKKNKQFSEDNEEIFIPPRLRTLYDLVMQYSIKGNYGVAIPLCEQTLIDIEKNYGICSNDYATMKHVLANVYRDIGDYQKAVCLMLEVLIIRESLPEISKTKVLNTLNCISSLYTLMYCWKEASHYCVKSILLLREISTGDDIAIAKQLETMAIICRNDHEVEKAIEYFKEALEIYGKNADNSLLDIYRLQSQLASCYLSQLQFDVALNLYKDIINNCYQEQLFVIWGIEKPLWKLAEEQLPGLTYTDDDLRSKYIEYRSLDALDVSGLRDVLFNMAFIYKQMNMNHAAEYLETWPDRNIPVQPAPVRTFKSRSLMNLNEELNLNDGFRVGCRLTRARRSFNHQPHDLGVFASPRANSQDYSCQRFGVTSSKKSNDIPVTIFEGWSKSFMKLSNKKK